MNAIVVVDRNWAIGREGNLLVHLPGDLKYYKEKTTGNVIVYGRKTLSTYPGGKPLPNRTNIVLTRNRDYENDGCIICHSREEVLVRGLHGEELSREIKRAIIEKPAQHVKLTYGYTSETSRYMNQIGG